MGLVKKKTIWLFGLIIGLGLLIIVLIALNYMKDKETNKEMDIFNKHITQLYFISNNRSSLVAEKAEIEWENDKKDDLVHILDLLKQGPKTTGLMASIPKEVNFLSLEYNEEKSLVTLNVSKEYKSLQAVDELWLRASLVKTLTDLDFVKQVQILIEGESLLGTDGKPIGPISEDDIVIGSTVPPIQANKKEINLYFANKDATGLVLEKREIEIAPNAAIEKAVVEQLIKGPVDPALSKTVPPETKIKAVEIKDGICYVDLSSEFRTKHWGGSTGETLTIYSIVNSLTDLPDVKKVQFLIEGEKQETFKGHIDFINPFDRNLDLIVQS